MRPRREAGRVRADTAPAPRRAEAWRSGSGRAAAARKESPSPVVWWGGVEPRTGGEGRGWGGLVWALFVFDYNQLISGNK